MGEPTKDDGLLKPFGEVIQVCPKCGKIDVYKGDGHFCNRQAEERRQEGLEHYD